MQLTFFIGQKIKCPGQSIYLNHASILLLVLEKARPDVAPTSPDERDGQRRPFQIATPCLGDQSSVGGRQRE